MTTIYIVLNGQKLANKTEILLLFIRYMYMVRAVRYSDSLLLSRWLADKPRLEKHLRAIEERLWPKVQAAYNNKIAPALFNNAVISGSLQIGNRQYDITKRISTSPISNVYLTISREDAHYYIVKELKDHSDNCLIRRFEQSMVLGQKLQHPAIVKAIDGVENCLVFPFIQGVNLDTYIKLQQETRTPIPPDQALMIIYRLAEALANIYHEEGVLHRDIKPPNIILNAYAPGFPMVCILDLEIAKWLKSQEDITPTGGFQGTLNYLAPEVVRFNLDYLLDERIDIFSLGVTLANILRPQTRNLNDSGDFMEWLSSNNPTFTPEQLAAFQWSWLIEPISRMSERDPRLRCCTFEEVKKLCAIGIYRYT